MHTYRKDKHGLWTVGYWCQDLDGAAWEPLCDFASEQDAAAYVSYLNGGEHPRKPWPAPVV